jgi:hypothetical protein
MFEQVHLFRKILWRNIVNFRPQDRSVVTRLHVHRLRAHHLRAHGLYRGHHDHHPYDQCDRARGSLKCGRGELPDLCVTKSHSPPLSPPLEPPRSLKPPRGPRKPPPSPPRPLLKPRSPRCRPRPPRACVKPSSSAGELPSTGDAITSAGFVSGISCGVSAGDGVLDVPNLACSPAMDGSPPSSSSAQSKFPDADNDAC